MTNSTGEQIKPLCVIFCFMWPMAMTLWFWTGNVVATILPPTTYPFHCAKVFTTTVSLKQSPGGYFEICLPYNS